MKKILALLLTVLTLVCALAFVGCSRSNEFTVTFVTNGGTCVNDATLTQTVSDAEDLVVPVLEREGYTFAGWDVSIADIDEDTIVRATWTPCTYTISFDNDEGVWNTGFNDEYTLSVKYGETVSGTFPTATKSGFKFEKWVIVDDDANLNGTAFSGDVEYTYTKNLKLKIQWVDDGKFIISYNSSPIEGLITSFDATDEPFELGTPIRTGYIFNGWTGVGYDNPTKEVTITPADVTDDLVFTANWTAKTYTIKLMNGKLQVKEISVVYGEPIGKLDALEGDVIFACWAYDDGEKEITFDGGIEIKDKWNIDADNIVFQAVWNESIKIRYELNYYSTEKRERYPVTVTGIDSNTRKEFNHGEKLSEAIKNLATPIEIDADEYKFSHWAYKNKQGEYKKLTTDSQVLVRSALVEHGEIVIYAVCYSVWMGPY